MTDSWNTHPPVVSDDQAPVDTVVDAYTDEEITALANFLSMILSRGYLAAIMYEKCMTTYRQELMGLRFKGIKKAIKDLKEVVDYSETDKFNTARVYRAAMSLDVMCNVFHDTESGDRTLGLPRELIMKSLRMQNNERRADNNM